jgi:hypothetical protein
MGKYIYFHLEEAECDDVGQSTDWLLDNAVMSFSVP